MASLRLHRRRLKHMFRVYAQRDWCVFVGVCVRLRWEKKIGNHFSFPSSPLMSHLGSPRSDCSFSSCCFLIGSLSCETGQLVETLRGSFNNRSSAPFRLVHHESEKRVTDMKNPFYCVVAAFDLIRNKHQIKMFYCFNVRRCACDIKHKPGKHENKTKSAHTGLRSWRCVALGNGKKMKWGWDETRMAGLSSGSMSLNAY